MGIHKSQCKFLQKNDTRMQRQFCAIVLPYKARWKEWNAFATEGKQTMKQGMMVWAALMAAGAVLWLGTQERFGAGVAQAQETAATGARRSVLLDVAFWWSAAAEDVRAALTAGADVHGTDETGRTALHYAAGFGKPAAVETLLNAGADVGAQAAQYRSTALHLAAAHNEVPTVAEALLRHGADVNAADALGNTPLHRGAWLGSTPAVLEVLMERGADVKAENNDGDTPLHLAVFDRETLSAAVLEMLLRHGANAHVRDSFGNTPLHVAVIRGDARVARLLLNTGADVRAQDKEGRTPCGLDGREILRRLGACP